MSNLMIGNDLPFLLAQDAVKTEALTDAETDLTAEPETKAAEENDLQEVSDQTDTEA